MNGGWEERWAKMPSRSFDEFKSKFLVGMILWTLYTSILNQVRLKKNE